MIGIHIRNHIWTFGGSYWRKIKFHILRSIRGNRWCSRSQSNAGLQLKALEFRWVRVVWVKILDRNHGNRWTCSLQEWLTTKPDSELESTRRSIRLDCSLRVRWSEDAIVESTFSTKSPYQDQLKINFFSGCLYNSSLKIENHRRSLATLCVQSFR